MVHYGAEEAVEAATFQVTPGQTVVDAVIDGKWAGGFLVSDWADDGLFVYRLFVEQQYRGNGIAAGLMRRAQEIAGGRPVYLEPSAFADSPMNSAQLAAWYERLGFVDAGDEINSRVAGDMVSRMLCWSRRDVA